MGSDFFKNLMGSIGGALNSAKDELSKTFTPSEEGYSRRVESSRSNVRPNEDAVDSREQKQEFNSSYSENQDKQNQNTSDQKSSENNLKQVGFPKLDELTLPLHERHSELSYVYIINKTTPEVEAFLKNFKDCAETDGIVVKDLFKNNPSEEEVNEIYDSEVFEDIRLMVLDEYMIGLSGLMPILDFNTLGLIARAMHPLYFKASEDLYKERGINTNSIDMGECMMMHHVWMKKFVSLFEKIPNFIQTDRPLKVYYEGDVTRQAFFFIFMLRRIGCDVIIVPDSSNKDIINKCYDKKWVENLFA